MLRRAVPAWHRRVAGATSSRAASSLAEARRRWNGRLVVSDEVEHALETGTAVVALETAIVTHGMPYPTNLTTAKSLESIIRSHGAVPATIALLDGNVVVGLTQAELGALADPATVRTAPAVKVSRRDMAPALALRRAGGTTVAGTMVIASSVGIQSFVTGGIGGVHRGAEDSMDISADLIELGRTPMMVVCAGAKSILDIPRTLEVLETQGVCVATYGDKPDFPAFYSPSSGCQSPWRVGTIAEAAAVAHTGLTLPSPLSTLLAVPIPAEYAERGNAVQIAVEQAVRESVEQGIDKRGKEVTPWLLKRVGELTKGSALELNIKLIENNAHIGAQVAKEVARLTNASPSAYVPSAVTTKPSTQPPAEPTQPTQSIPLPKPTVLVFGSAAIDLTSKTPGAIVPRTTTPGRVSVTPGGVGRNIAEAAQNLLPAGAVQLISAIGAAAIPDTPDADPAAGAAGTDTFGTLLKLEMTGAGLRTDGLVTAPGSTAVCSLVLEHDGDLVGGVADMGIVETISGDIVAQRIAETKPRMVVFDCNLLAATITSLLAACAEHGVAAFSDPTSTPKLARLLPALRAHPRALTYLSPNELELDALYTALTEDDDDGRGWAFVNALGLQADWRAGVEALSNRSGAWIRSGVVTKMVATMPWVGGFWLKAGAAGVLHLRVQKDRPEVGSGVAHRVPSGELAGQWLVLTHYPAPVIGADEIVSSTGAGDSLVGGVVAGLVNGGEETEWVAQAIEGVGRCLRSHRAVA